MTIIDVSISCLTKQAWNLHFAVSHGNPLISVNRVPQSTRHSVGWLCSVQACGEIVTFALVPQLFGRNYVKRNDVDSFERLAVGEHL